MKNDLIRGRRWYTLLASVLLVAFVGYYLVTGATPPRYEHFFRNEPWAMQHLMHGDIPRLWTVFIAPLSFVGGVLIFRMSNRETGYTEGALFGTGVICMIAGILMLPWGVGTGLIFFLGALALLAAMALGLVGVRFVFSKKTWKALGAWLKAADVEEKQKKIEGSTPSSSASDPLACQ